MRRNSGTKEVDKPPPQVQSSELSLPLQQKVQLEKEKLAKEKVLFLPSQKIELFLDENRNPDDDSLNRVEPNLDDDRLKIGPDNVRIGSDEKIVNFYGAEKRKGVQVYGKRNVKSSGVKLCPNTPVRPIIEGGKVNEAGQQKEPVETRNVGNQGSSDVEVKVGKSLQTVPQGQNLVRIITRGQSEPLGPLHNKEVVRSSEDGTIDSVKLESREGQNTQVAESNEPNRVGDLPSQAIKIEQEQSYPEEDDQNVDYLEKAAEITNKISALVSNSKVSSSPVRSGPKLTTVDPKISAVDSSKILPSPKETSSSTVSNISPKVATSLTTPYAPPLNPKVTSSLTTSQVSAVSPKVATSLTHVLAVSPKVATCLTPTPVLTSASPKVPTSLTPSQVSALSPKVATSLTTPHLSAAKIATSLTPSPALANASPKVPSSSKVSSIASPQVPEIRRMNEPAASKVSTITPKPSTPSTTKPSTPTRLATASTTKPTTPNSTKPATPCSTAIPSTPNVASTNATPAAQVTSWDIEIAWQNKKILIPLFSNPKAGIEKIIQKLNAGHFVYKNEKDKRGDVISANKPSIIQQLTDILKSDTNSNPATSPKTHPVCVRLLEHKEPLTLKRKIQELHKEPMTLKRKIEEFTLQMSVKKEQVSAKKENEFPVVNENEGDVKKSRSEMGEEKHVIAAKKSRSEEIETRGGECVDESGKRGKVEEERKSDATFGEDIRTEVSGGQQKVTEEKIGTVNTQVGSSPMGIVNKIQSIPEPNNEDKLDSTLVKTRKESTDPTKTDCKKLKVASTADRTVTSKDKNSPMLDKTVVRNKVNCAADPTQEGLAPPRKIVKLDPKPNEASVISTPKPEPAGMRKSNITPQLEKLSLQAKSNSQETSIPAETHSTLISKREETSSSKIAQASTLKDGKDPKSTRQDAKDISKDSRSSNEYSRTISALEASQAISTLQHSSLIDKHSSGRHLNAVKQSTSEQYSYKSERQFSKTHKHVGQSITGHHPSKSPVVEHTTTGQHFSKPNENVDVLREDPVKQCTSGLSSVTVQQSTPETSSRLHGDIKHNKTINTDQFSTKSKDSITPNEDEDLVDEDMNDDFTEETATPSNATSLPEDSSPQERTIPRRVVRTLRPQQNKFNSPHTKGCLKVLKPCIR